MRLFRSRRREAFSPLLELGVAGVTGAGELVSDRISESVAGDRRVDLKKVPAERRAILEEAFRSLRSRLLLLARDGSRTFLITSATPSEGKSTVAANVACALASVGRTVLLIDADLRRPRLHDFFGLANREGLTDVLNGTKQPADVWRPTVNGPTVLTSGSRAVDPQYLLQGERLVAVLATAREHFEFTLVDTAPVLAVDDACLLAGHLDGTILVVKYAAVSETDAREAVERLHAARASIVGTVMSQMTDLTDGYHAYGAGYVNPDR